MRIRDAVVGGADNAADRGRAVAQRCRAAHDLDLVGGERIDRHEMIFAEIGDAAAADAVLDDADAIDVEAADDRPAGGARREAGAGDARFGEQEIAERGAAGAAEFLVGHDGHGGELIGHDRQHALLGCGGDGAGCAGRPLAIAARCGAGDAAGVRDGSGSRRTIGLGAVTVMSGSWVEDEGAAASRPARRCRSREGMAAAPPMWSARLLCECHDAGPDSVEKRRTDFDLSLMDQSRVTRRSPRGASTDGYQEAGGARDWNAGWTEAGESNSASVVRYSSSTACGSCNSGGVAKAQCWPAR